VTRVKPDRFAWQIEITEPNKRISVHRAIRATEVFYNSCLDSWTSRLGEAAKGLSARSIAPSGRYMWKGLSEEIAPGTGCCMSSEAATAITLIFPLQIRTIEPAHVGDVLPLWFEESMFGLDNRVGCYWTPYLRYSAGR